MKYEYIELRPFQEYKEMVEEVSKDEIVKCLYDTLKQKYELQNQVEKLTQENNDLENLYILARDNLSKALLENADLKERLNCDLKWALKYDELFFKNKHLQSVIDKAIEKIQLLIDIGFDYDGYRQADSLMTLIDELVSYAKESRDILRSKE